MASCLIQLEVQSCTAAGSLATVKPGLMSTVPQAGRRHGDGGRKRVPQRGAAAECVFKRVADVDGICPINLKRIHDKKINEDVPDICTGFMSQLEAAYQAETRRIPTLPESPGFTSAVDVRVGGCVISSFLMPPVACVFEFYAGMLDR